MKVPKDILFQKSEWSGGLVIHIPPFGPSFLPQVDVGKYKIWGKGKLPHVSFLLDVGDSRTCSFQSSQNHNFNLKWGSLGILLDTCNMSPRRRWPQLFVMPISSLYPSQWQCGEESSTSDNDDEEEEDDHEFD